MVVNWAGPGRAGVILGKACFPSLFHSFAHSALCIDISDLPREVKVWCLLLVKKERQRYPFLLSASLWVPCVCVDVGVCLCVPSALQIILVSTQQLWLSTNRWN